MFHYELIYGMNILVKASMSASLVTDQNINPSEGISIFHMILMMDSINLAPWSSNSCLLTILCTRRLLAPRVSPETDFRRNPTSTGGDLHLTVHDHPSGKLPHHAGGLEARDRGNVQRTSQ